MKIDIEFDILTGVYIMQNTMHLGGDGCCEWICKGGGVGLKKRGKLYQNVVTRVTSTYFVLIVFDVIVEFMI